MGVGGIIIGVIMLRYGILATLIWHFSVDAIYTAFLLLRSHNTYLMISGAVTGGIMLVPLFVALIAYWRSGTFVEEDQLTNGAEGISRPPREEAAAEQITPLVYQPLSSQRLLAAGILGAAFVALAFVPVQRFGKGIEIRVGKQQALESARTFLSERHVDVSGWRSVAWLEDNFDRDAVKYMEQRKSVEETDKIYRQATKLVLWRVRFFRPLEKEEHLVLVDPTDGSVFAYWHTLDEDAPGATLTPDEARALAEKAVVEHGYKLDGFDLQNSESKKRKARTDYTLTWQAKPGDPRNVGDDHYRLIVHIAGDQVVSFARHFKLPEDWLREEAATHLSQIILIANNWVLLGGGLVAGLLILFVLRLKAGQLRWRPSAKVAAFVAIGSALTYVNLLPLILSRYPTSNPFGLFMLIVAVTYLLLVLLAGLFAWLVITLATSFYPDAWRIFRATDRRIWRRDALVAIVLTVAAAAGMGRMNLFLEARFHAYLPSAVNLAPNSYSAYLPGGAILVRALIAPVIAACIVAMVIYLVRLGISRRAWWLWIGLAALLVSFGPSGADSWKQFAAGWVVHFLPVAVFALIIAVWFRNNILAYVGASFAIALASPLVEMIQEPQSFLRMNGIAVAIAALLVFLWLFSGGKTEPAPGSPPAAIEPQ